MVLYSVWFTAAALPDVVPTVLDPLMRASLWITARNAVEHATLDPATAVDLLVAGIPTEELDIALSVLDAWAADDGQGTRGVVHEKLLPFTADPDTARGRIHAAFRERAASAPQGSELQFAAAQGAIGTSDDEAWLRSVLDGGTWPGLDLDTGMRWKVLQRLSSIGAVDLAELDRELDADNDAKSQIAHAWCHARLPDPDAKAWAWLRFTGWPVALT